MINRGSNFKSVPLNIVGSSIFGRYPKISDEYTYNMLISDDFLVPYSGYQVAIKASQFSNETQGRGCFTSTKFGKMVIVLSQNVYLVNIQYNQTYDTIISEQIIKIGQLQTTEGIVYITENNKPQILISDGQGLYVYDPTQTPEFQAVAGLDFTPGYVTFHDTYFICAASEDSFYSPPANNTWRLSDQNNGLSWPSQSANIGLLQTKPDNTQAVIRFPSKGNMIFVMGSIVAESWFDTGAQLFPYQRNNQFNIDYGCLSAATVAYMDEFVVWLAQNEKSGPIIVYSDGGMPKPITTDGIDFKFSQLQNPQDSQAFLYRQDGHLIYHINFYSDNLSLFYDFNTQKFFHATDQNGDYFIASQMAFFDNQYYFVSRNTGNLYAFDTIFTTYGDTLHGFPISYEIPRRRICKNIRNTSQDYFIANDVGFTIESGETNYQQQLIGPLTLVTQDGQTLIANGNSIYLQTQDNQYLLTQDGNYLIANQTTDQIDTLIAQQSGVLYTTPAVDLSISCDGGASFGNEFRYSLPPIGVRKNRLLWWQLGVVNDLVCQFKFWGIGRFVCTDGEVNIRL